MGIFREKLEEPVRRQWDILMTARAGFVCALIAAGVAGGGIAFGVARVLDASEITTLTADRDLARHCREAGSRQPPCPVIYKNTKIEWRTKTVAQRVEISDPKQAAPIAELENENARLRHKHRTITYHSSQSAKVPPPECAHLQVKGLYEEGHTIGMSLPSCIGGSFEDVHTKSGCPPGTDCGDQGVVVRDPEPTAKH